MKVAVYIKSCPQKPGKITKTKTALKQETYNLSDLKHDLHCGFVELGGSVDLGLVPPPGVSLLVVSVTVMAEIYTVLRGWWL